MLALASCAKTPVKKIGTPGSSPTTAFSVLFPHIDTATLHNVWGGGSTSGYAKIKVTGELTIYGYGAYPGGSYKIQLTDSSSGGYPVKSFNLIRAGVDTLISEGNGIAIFPASGASRGYYWMQIDGGNLQDNQIMRGDFVDSI